MYIKAEPFRPMEPDPLTLEDSVLHGGQTVPPLKLN